MSSGPVLHLCPWQKLGTLRKNDVRLFCTLEKNTDAHAHVDSSATHLSSDTLDATDVEAHCIQNLHPKQHMHGCSCNMSNVVDIDNWGPISVSSNAKPPQGVFAPKKLTCMAALSGMSVRSSESCTQRARHMRRSTGCQKTDRG
jgi:hypothetical protein